MTTSVGTGAAGAGAAGAGGAATLPAAVGGVGTGVVGTTGVTAPAMMMMSSLLPGIGLGLLKGLFIGATYTIQ